PCGRKRTVRRLLFSIRDSLPVERVAVGLSVLTDPEKVHHARLFNMVLITIIHFDSLGATARNLAFGSVSLGVVLGLLITGVPLGLKTLLVALTRDCRSCVALG